jgi:hypothetical protein
MTTKTHPSDTDDIIIVILTLISIIITELISCFTPSPKKLLQPSVTNPSTKKKVSSSTRQSATSGTHPQTPSPALVTSTETSRESSVASGSQPETTTPKRRRTNSQAGTTYPATKTSKSTRSIASAIPQGETKSNQIIQTPGLGFSA